MVAEHVGSGAPEPVRDALTNALSLGEIGVQVAAYHHGRLIVDAWAGTKDVGGDPVDGDTLFNIFSVGKAFVAAAAHVQADRGLVEYDAPVATYWPEYAAHGKAEVTLRHILMHRSGVPQMPDGVTSELWKDWEWMATGLAKVEPVYPPGTRNTYQSMVFAWLVGEIVRRTDPTHRPLAVFIQDEICRPLGINSFFTGVPDTELHRAAALSYHVLPPRPRDDELIWRAVPEALDFRPAFYNRTETRQTRLNGFGDLSNARSVARFFAMVAGKGQVDGTRIVSETALLDATIPRPDYDVTDETYGYNRKMLVGRGGFWVAQPDIPVLDRRGSQKILCHPGAGTTIGWADLDNDLSIAICHNRMFTAIENHPWPAIAKAVLDVAGVTR